jgi:aspartate/methionine/tyrosine aminotransferase
MADLFLSVNGPVQQALPGLLAGRDPFQRAVMERVRVNLARLVLAVEKHPELTRLNADGGWVAMLRVPEVRSDEEWALELMRRGVVVHPGHFYDVESGAHLVVSLIVEPRVFDEALGVIEAMLAGA